MARAVVGARRLPLVVVVLGATGTGKSRLALQLGVRFGGEIVSADSMQIYQGLDIITNKVSAQEQKLCKHHMISFVDPLVTNYTVLDFQKKATAIISFPRDSVGTRIRKRGFVSLAAGCLLSAVVSYFGESVSCDHLLSLQEESRAPAVVTEEWKAGLENLESEELHHRLSLVDPNMATRLHPHNKRKIIRSLQLFEQTGLPHSELLRRQHEEKGGGPLGGPLKYPNACIFWLHAEQAVLEVRLDQRVDEMMEAGLVEELQNFHRRYNQERVAENSQDYQQGIFQSIGFKEFHQFLVSEAQGPEEVRQQLLDQGLPDGDQEVCPEAEQVGPEPVLEQTCPVFGLDVSDLSQWEKSVWEPAAQVVESFLKGQEPPMEPLRLEPMPAKEKQSCRLCELCSRVIIGDREWRAHLKSRSHVSLLKKSQRSALLGPPLAGKGCSSSSNSDAPAEKTDGRTEGGQ
ncbi:hypothetical protein E2320_000247 [Naja naja]|nr:hypothetical protein E2320_000247 [Naja naja]